MGSLSDKISPEDITFIQKQKLFFVATAPNEGRINLSPKGHDCFRVLDENTVMYLDLTGSGNETCAHLLENGRITLMFCSFDRRPNILRLYGSGKPILPTDDNWQKFYNQFEPLPGVRQIFLITINSVQSSCGYAVPFYDFVSERETLKKYNGGKTEEQLEDYRIKKNSVSIDGKPIHKTTSKT